jgi:hypothetical protein
MSGFPRGRVYILKNNLCFNIFNNYTSLLFWCLKAFPSKVNLPFCLTYVTTKHEPEVANLQRVRGVNAAGQAGSGKVGVLGLEAPFQA